MCTNYTVSAVQEYPSNSPVLHHYRQNRKVIQTHYSEQLARFKCLSCQEDRLGRKICSLGKKESASMHGPSILASPCRCPSQATDPHFLGMSFWEAAFYAWLFAVRLQMLKCVIEVCHPELVKQGKCMPVLVKGACIPGWTWIFTPLLLLGHSSQENKDKGCLNTVGLFGYFFYLDFLVSFALCIHQGVMCLKVKGFDYCCNLK